MKTYIGIDPGLDGGIGFLSEAGMSAFPMPFVISEKKKGGKTTHKRKLDIAGLKSLLISQSAIHPQIAIIERQGAMPGQGVVSQFSIGLNYGMILGLLEGLEIPVVIIAPQSWKKEMLAGTLKDKAASIQTAQRLFPNINLKRTEKCTVLHDGMAEAALLAELGRRKNL